MPKINLKALRDALPWGAQTEVAKKFKTSTSYINQVLLGKIENEAVLEELFIKAKDYQRKCEKIQNELTKLKK